METVVYVSGGVAYEARGETLIIDFDHLEEAGATEQEQEAIEQHVENGEIDKAREEYNAILLKAEEA